MCAVVKFVSEESSLNKVFPWRVLFRWLLIKGLNFSSKGGSACLVKRFVRNDGIRIRRFFLF